MNSEDSLSSLGVGISDSDLSVKASRSEKRRIKDIGTVCCGNDYNALIFFKSIHLNKKLVESLLSFIVTAAHSCASVTAYCIDLVYKDYGRRLFFRLVKKVSDSRSADTDIHLDKI